MPDLIEPAKSGRANCRGCKRAIGRGELRFGEALLNPYADGEAMVWYHLLCAACMRPDKFGPVLDAYGETVAGQDWLHHAVQLGLSHPRLQRLLRAERAASGSARCRQCRETIGKGDWRLALQIFEEGRMQPIGTIHAECAAAYFGTTDIIEHVERLTQALNPESLAEIEQCVRSSRRRENEHSVL